MISKLKLKNFLLDKQWKIENEKFSGNENRRINSIINEKSLKIIDETLAAIESGELDKKFIKGDFADEGVKLNQEIKWEVRS